MKELVITRKEQSRPCNWAYFYLTAPTLKGEIRVVLENGVATHCSRHRSANTLNPCQCMNLAAAAPDKDQYWQPYLPDPNDDYSDLVDM